MTLSLIPIVLLLCVVFCLCGFCGVTLSLFIFNNNNNNNNKYSNNNNNNNNYTRGLNCRERYHTRELMSFHCIFVTNFICDKNPLYGMF